MERLTEWTGEQWIPVQKRIAGKYPGNRVCMEQLAKYENTGLTPEEIMDGKLLTGWIPVSEQLPEAVELESFGDEVTPVLITYLGYYDKEPHEGGLAIWCEDNTWRWHDETLHVNMMDVVKVEITAWMPLPEPYRPE